MIVMSIIGCTSSSDRNIKSIYKKKTEILSIFSKVSVFRTDTRNNVFLHTYNKGLKNVYVFTKSQNKYSLFRDSLSITPDSILNINRGEIDRFSYKSQLIDKLEFYLKEMDSLNINDVTSEFSKQGIDLKIYVKPQGVLLYVSDGKKVLNEEWSKYIKPMKQLDDYWFYTTKE